MAFKHQVAEYMWGCKDLIWFAEYWIRFAECTRDHYYNSLLTFILLRFRCFNQCFWGLYWLCILLFENSAALTMVSCCKFTSDLVRDRGLTKEINWHVKWIIALSSFLEPNSMRMVAGFSYYWVTLQTANCVSVRPQGFAMHLNNFTFHPYAALFIWCWW